MAAWRGAVELPLTLAALRSRSARPPRRRPLPEGKARALPAAAPPAAGARAAAGASSARRGSAGRGSELRVGPEPPMPPRCRGSKGRAPWPLAAWGHGLRLRRLLRRLVPQQLVVPPQRLRIRRFFVASCPSAASRRASQHCRDGLQFASVNF
ncbi:unnamed protein product [Miscanthus lutarioriparius]|uniref:Uncharacterized protein n=1 Tax=Miscanthus lutarioriparius TaxID=422564 RepID=A0A811RHH9_9POAL|nr:unnamed protein product [Miscanthus lutarioriparius]